MIALLVLFLKKYTVKEIPKSRRRDNPNSMYIFLLEIIFFRGLAHKSTTYVHSEHDEKREIID